MNLLSIAGGLFLALVGVGNLYFGSQTYQIPTTASPTLNRIEVVTAANPASGWLLFTGGVQIVSGVLLVVYQLIPDDGIDYHANTQPSSLTSQPQPLQTTGRESIETSKGETEEPEDFSFGDDPTDYLNNILT